MAWKQDLAKLKQHLGPDTQPTVPKPPARTAPASAAPLEDEDAVFLSAMGMKPKARPQPPVPSTQPAEATPAQPAPALPESFEAALKDMKGLKPLGKTLPGTAKTPEAAPEATLVPLVPAVAQPALPEPPPAPVHLEPVVAPPLPLRFQLAAGMAIEVDGALDLRGHTLADALARLQDRLGDGQVLGWRSLLVTLGQGPELHEGLLALLGSGQAPMVARFAQAPVPMGGNQAWLLYFGTVPNPS